MVKFDKNEIKQLLIRENKFITNLFQIFDVPEVIDDDVELDQYLLNPHKKITRPPTYEKLSVTHVKQNDREKKKEEKQVLNKLNSKKGGLKKSKKNMQKKELKKHVKMAMKLNPQIGGEQFSEISDDKKDLKSTIDKKSLKSQFNEEGKIVFSKIEIPQSGSKFDRPNKKKSGKNKIEKNPLKLIKNLKQQKEEIKELEASGEKEKASELKKGLAWKKAFELTEGKKIRDNPELIMRSLKLKRAQKRKSKTDWKDRKEKVQTKIDEKIKKRQQNIDKKIQAKKTKKMKTLTKRGRVIPGF